MKEFLLNNYKNKLRMVISFFLEEKISDVKFKEHLLKMIMIMLVF